MKKKIALIMMASMLVLPLTGCAKLNAILEVLAEDETADLEGGTEAVYEEPTEETEPTVEAAEPSLQMPFMLKIEEKTYPTGLEPGKVSVYEQFESDVYCSNVSDYWSENFLSTVDANYAAFNIGDYYACFKIDADTNGIKDIVNAQGKIIQYEDCARNAKYVKVDEMGNQIFQANDLYNDTQRYIYSVGADGTITSYLYNTSESETVSEAVISESEGIQYTPEDFENAEEITMDQYEEIRHQWRLFSGGICTDSDYNAALMMVEDEANKNQAYEGDPLQKALMGVINESPIEAESEIIED